MPIIACKCPVCQSEDSKDKRLRTSALVEAEGKTFVIDSGPDFRYQMLRAGVNQLDAILFTHEHKDHTAGLDDIRAFNWVNKSAVVPVWFRFGGCSAGNLISKRPTVWNRLNRSPEKAGFKRCSALLFRLWSIWGIAR